MASFKSGKKVLEVKYFKHFNRFLIGFSIFGLMLMFFPWTQTITGKGQVTTLTPDQRPQTIQSPIPGRIEKWFVKEGDLVKKGDTILEISEVKSDYFDPNISVENWRANSGKILLCNFVWRKGESTGTSDSCVEFGISFKVTTSGKQIDSIPIEG